MAADLEVTSVSAHDGGVFAVTVESDETRETVELVYSREDGVELTSSAYRSTETTAERFVMADRQTIDRITEMAEELYRDARAVYWRTGGTV